MYILIDNNNFKMTYLRKLIRNFSHPRQRLNGAVTFGEHISLKVKMHFHKIIQTSPVHTVKTNLHNIKQILDIKLVSGDFLKKIFDILQFIVNHIADFWTFSQHF